MSSNEYYNKTVFCPLILTLINYFPVYPYHSVRYDMDKKFKDKEKFNENIDNIPVNAGDIVCLYGYVYTKDTVVEQAFNNRYRISLKCHSVYSTYDRTCETISTDSIAQWFPTDFIQKKKLVMKELLAYFKTIDMKKITNFVINYITKRDVKW